MACSSLCCSLKPLTNVKACNALEVSCPILCSGQKHRASRRSLQPTPGPSNNPVILRPIIHHGTPSSPCSSALNRNLMAGAPGQGDPRGEWLRGWGPGRGASFLHQWLVGGQATTIVQAEVHRQRRAQAEAGEGSLSALAQHSASRTHPLCF